jgi:hypothetical protein
MEIKVKVGSDAQRLILNNKSLRKRPSASERLNMMRMKSGLKKKKVIT